MDTDGLDTAIRASGFPGVVVVRHAGATVFGEAYGYATPRWQIPNTVDTRFDTASITKLFTSVAVLQQVGAGRLDLDASIHSYIDLSGTTISEAVTLRHLLTHTSGIADDADEEAGEIYAELFVDKPCYAVMETVDFLPQFAHKPARAEPGSQARYCNASYVLAGLALERVVEESYRSYVTKEVFQPAGIVHRVPRPRIYSDEELLDEVRRVATLVSGPVTERHFTDLSTMASIPTLLRHFGHWRDVLARAGLGERYGGRTVSPKLKRHAARTMSDDEIIAELQRVAAVLNTTTLTRADVLRHSSTLGARVFLSRAQPTLRVLTAPAPVRTPAANNRPAGGSTYDTTGGREFVCRAVGSSGPALRSGERVLRRPEPVAVSLSGDPRRRPTHVPPNRAAS